MGVASGDKKSHLAFLPIGFKAIYRRVYGLVVSDSKPMTIVVGSMTAGGQPLVFRVSLLI